MATPALIYAFDNLGPDRFAELCGLLLAGRYKGFLLSGPGPDAGVDAELDAILGEWLPEERSALFGRLVPPAERVLFQFKHKVTARVGQASSRSQLLRLYRAEGNRVSEVCKPLVVAKAPQAYVLVTNVEVSASFRIAFQEACRSANPAICHYQVIGIDELEQWVRMDHLLRSQYFPAIFGPPRFDLHVKMHAGTFHTASATGGYGPGTRYLEVAVLNVGSETSYVERVDFRNIVDGEERLAMEVPFPAGHHPLGSDPFRRPLPPGRKQSFRYFASKFASIEPKGRVFLVEAMVQDEIGNTYSAPFTEEVRQFLLDPHGSEGA